MNINPVILSIPIYFGLILIEWTYDLIKKKGIYRLSDAFGNISCGMFEQITGVFLKILSIGIYVFIFDRFRIATVPTTWPFIILMWVVVDFLYYWAHRWSHTINLFWLGHVVHHQSEDYNFSVALRQGALQKVFTFWVYLPMAFLGFDPVWFVIISALNTVYQFWIHTEQINRMGWFGLIFNTPSHHRVHHGRNPKYIDKNHAGSLIIWDKMFGTFSAEEDTPVYGITKPNMHWDPVSSHIQPFADLFKDMKNVSGIGNKLALLWNPPGWLPKENGGMRFPPEVDKSSYSKFNIKIDRTLSIYLFIQFLFVLGGTAFFLFNFTNFEMRENLALSGLLIFSVISLGLLFEARKFAWIIEMMRLLLLLFLNTYFLQGPESNFVDVILVASMAIVIKTRNTLYR